VLKAQKEDAFTQKVLVLLGSGAQYSKDISLGVYEDKAGVLYYRNRIWVPEKDDARTKLIREVYDQKLVGHPGVATTLWHIKKTYI
jgi:hypothetical protein